MATGYTWPIRDGEVTDFREFAMRCARAFGHCIEMRDDPIDKLPTADREVDTHHENALRRSRESLSELDGMTHVECQAKADDAYERELENWREREADRLRTRKRYEAMLAKVEAWQPPTNEHSGLKEFMVQQLAESIEHDCSGKWDRQPERKSADEWRKTTVEAVMHSIDYHRKKHAEEVERVTNGNAWISQLVDSLD